MMTLLLMCFLSFAGGKPSVDAASPSPLKYPVAVKVKSERHEYRKLVRSLREIDFKNLRYFVAGQQFLLRNGFSHKDRRIDGTDTSDHFDLSLGPVWYFDFEDNQPRRALVSIQLVVTAASSSNIGFVLLFEVANNHPVVTQQFEYDRQAAGAGVAFSKRLGILTIKARAQDDSPHCCPQYLEIDEFKWQGREFRLIRRKMLNLQESGTP